jgi:hypothetical protein
VIASFEIEAPEVETILARCRAEGTTLQGALMAVALLLVGGPVVRCLAPANVRNLCPPIAGDFGLYISSGIALHENRSRNSLWEVARSARAQLNWRQSGLVPDTAGPTVENGHQRLLRVVGAMQPG